MKINYQETLNKAKELNLISEIDSYLFCTVRPKDGKTMEFIRKYCITNMIFYL